jgi:DNA/RNA-binding domain of Phe-tRNA-synthetase-like protein
MDSQSRLFSSFDSSKSNVHAILSEGHQVIYNVDATRIHETLFLGSRYHNIDVAKTDNDRVDNSSITVPLPISIHDQPDPLTAAAVTAAYDLVLWNFPHKVGKQNIKHNR